MGGFCCGGKGDKMKIVSEFQGHSIELLAPWQGGDLLVEIRGGCRPHIGCISTCWFEKGEMKFKKLLLPEHRDDVIGDRFSKALARQLHTTVCVVCGIHYDGVSKDDIAEIVAETERMLFSLQRELCQCDSMPKRKEEKPES